MSVRNLQSLLTARRLLVIGAPQSEAHRQILAHLGAAAVHVEYSDAAQRTPARVVGAVDLALVFDSAALDEAMIQALLVAGCRGLLCCHGDGPPPLLQALMREGLLRVVGPDSVGLMVPAKLNASVFAQASAGRVALIAQSASVAAAAMDWAAGRGIGFSWVVHTGAEADADVGDFLDVAALDPGTRAVVLQLSALRSARKFMSAARACARAKPVIVLQSRIDEPGHSAEIGADPVRSAAFARAGLIEVTTMDEMFDALAAVDRLPQTPSMRVLVVGNGRGICALGVDAVRRYGLAHAVLSPSSCQRLAAIDPGAQLLHGAVNLGAVSPQQQVELLRLTLADCGCDTVMLLHSPCVGPAQERFAEALVEAALGPRVVTAWLGLESARGARVLCAAAGIATFGSAGQAARALHYRKLHRQTQELLMRTPPEHARLPVERRRARSIIRRSLARGAPTLTGAAAQSLLGCYGLRRLADAEWAQQAGLRLTVQLQRHAELGMVLAVSARSPGFTSGTVYGLPPLDLLIAERVGDGLGLQLDESVRRQLAQAALPLSQLALDLPEVESLWLEVGVDADGLPRLLPGAQMGLCARPLSPRQRLALAPYPQELGGTARLKDGSSVWLRPIRPEDEPALLALLQSLDPEEVRLRFFHVIRHFSHDMAARMTQIDYDREMAFIAVPVAPEDQAHAPVSAGRIMGLANLIADPDHRRAEYSVLVHHDFAGQGLGRALMTQLLSYARLHDIGVVHGEVLAANAPMLALCAQLGFVQRPVPHDARVLEVEWRAATAPPSSAGIDVVAGGS